MNFLQLYYFTLIAETENITKAAEIAYISTSGLSRAMTRLEEEVGTSLLIRHSNRVSLNRAGQIFLDFAEKSLETQKHYLKMIEESVKQDALRVKIVVPGDLTISEPYDQVKLQYPDIMIEQTVAPTEKAKSLLENYKADIVVSNLPIEDDKIDCKLLSDDVLHIGVSKEHWTAKAGISNVELSDVASELLLVPDTNEDMREYILQQYASEGVHPNISQTSSYVSFRSIQKNEGIGFMRKLDSHHSSEVNMDFHFLEVKHPEFRLQTYISIRKDVELNERTSALYQLIVKHHSDLNR